MSYTPAVGDDVQYLGRCHNWRGIHFVVLGGDPPRARQHGGALDLDMSVEPDRWHRIGRNGIPDRERTAYRPLPAPLPPPSVYEGAVYQRYVDELKRDLEGCKRDLGLDCEPCMPTGPAPPVPLPAKPIVPSVPSSAVEWGKLGLPTPVYEWKCSGSPLDDCIDGVTLRRLLELDENLRRDIFPANHTTVNRATFFSELQHVAIQSHWWKQLREQQHATRERERERDRNQVVVDLDW